MKYNLSNILEKISLYRLSGIKNFVVIDIYKKFAHLSYVQLKEPFYKINKSSLVDKYNILHTEIVEHNNDFAIVTASLKKLSKEQNLDEGFIVVGVNEFRFKTIKIDADIEDKELWFFENIDKFLPEGHQIDDFLFSYEKYYKDEDNDYYYLNIARKNYIENITKACQIDGFKIITISTFPLSIHTLDFADNKNVLFLNIVSDKIIYSYSDDKNTLIYGESFLNTDNNSATSDSIGICLSEIKQNLFAFLPKATENLNIFFSSQNAIAKETTTQLEKIFLTESINSKPFNIDASQLNLVFVLTKLLTGGDYQINLLPLGIKDENCEIVEKKTSLRLILSLGAVLVFLLLALYFTENFISTQIQNNENSLVEVDVKTKMVKNFKKENKRLIANLALLNELKGERFVYSNILYSIIDGIGNNGCLTKFVIDDSDKKLKLNMQGLAYSQKDVTNIVNRMEELDNFSNVTLEYANKIEKSKRRKKISLPRKSMITFSLVADYYDNKQ